jgi:hypothetical protein
MIDTSDHQNVVVWLAARQQTSTSKTIKGKTRYYNISKHTYVAYTVQKNPVGQCTVPDAANTPEASKHLKSSKIPSAFSMCLGVSAEVFNVNVTYEKKPCLTIL